MPASCTRKSLSQQLVHRDSLPTTAIASEKYTRSGNQKKRWYGRGANRNRGRLHKLEARKSECLLVKRQRASTSCLRSEFCD